MIFLLSEVLNKVDVVNVKFYVQSKSETYFYGEN